MAGKVSLHPQLNPFSNFMSTPIITIATSKLKQSFFPVTKLFQFPLFTDSKKCSHVARPPPLRSSARELDIGRALITPLLKVVHEQPANQQSRYQPMAAAKSHCPSGGRPCTRAKGNLAHAFCANKLFHKQGFFGNVPFWFFWLSRSVLGLLSRTQHPVLHTHYSKSSSEILAGPINRDK